MLEVVDDGVQRPRIDQPLLDHQRLQRPDPERHVGRRVLAVTVVVIVVVVRHAAKVAQMQAKVKPRAKVKRWQVTTAPSPAMLAALGGS